MSNYLAIATVTTALAQMAEAAAQSVVPGAEVLTSLPDPKGKPSNRIHLFLYQISPNGAMRNNDLPTRASSGQVVTLPAVALDLHYMLTFYGSDSDLESQRMLGAVVRALHARPVLTRARIEAAISSQTFLSDSDLADSVEQVKFTPLAFSLDEMSKLWSVFFQIPYALSVAYQGTVVLIESEESAQPALPVLKLGETGQGVEVILGPLPVVVKAYFGMPTDVISRPRPVSLPAAQLGLAVIVAGSNLGADNVFLRFHHSKLDLTQELAVAPADISAKELKVLLPTPGTETSQGDWAPGVYTVTVVQKQSGTVRDRNSNGLPIAMAPIIAAMDPGTIVSRDGEGTAKITIICQPRVRSGQQAFLVLAGREIPGRIDVDDPDKIIFDVKKAPVVASEPIRLRVDGIESMPFKRVDTPPPSRFEFDNNQRVTIT